MAFEGKGGKMPRKLTDRDIADRVQFLYEKYGSKKLSKSFKVSQRTINRWRDETRHPNKKHRKQINQKYNRWNKYWRIHAKLQMTYGKGGGSLEIEAFMDVREVKKENAIQHLRDKINEMFSSGYDNFDEVADIRYFANRIDKSEVEKEGVVKWRDEKLRDLEKWKQQTITNYL
jgi:hypothetical protein